jgi:hypothetical protein
MEWHYWGTGQGKGPHDGVGAFLKQFIQKEQLKANGVILHNASINVVNFLKANMSLLHAAYAIAKQQLQRVFLEIKARDVNRNHGFDCRTVIGFHSIHSICSMNHRNNVLLQVRDFSCFLNFFGTALQEPLLNNFTFRVHHV